MRDAVAWGLLLLGLWGCASGGRRRAVLDAAADSTTDAGETDGAVDGVSDSMVDGAVVDVGVIDAMIADGGPVDAGPDVPAIPDASRPDAGPDAPGPMRCSSPADCPGDFCVDGYCCNGPCFETCFSCAVAGSEGVCSVDMAESCDDGDACTHGETCMAEGLCGGGTTLDCDGMDTPCVDYSCDGSMMCAESVRTGMTCDDGDAATTNDRCLADGTCAGSVGCTMPADACADGDQSRDRCSGARVIGRRSASSASGYSATGDTCSARNRFDDCSWDAGNDHAYRMWMRNGEQATVRISRTLTCSSDFDITLKLYQSTGCTDVTCGSDLWCEDFARDGRNYTYTAPRDGWVVFVVDGSTAFDDEGRYRLDLQLTGCADDCGCP